MTSAQPIVCSTARLSIAEQRLLGLKLALAAASIMRGGLEARPHSEIEF